MLTTRNLENLACLCVPYIPGFLVVYTCQFCELVKVCGLLLFVVLMAIDLWLCC